MDVEPIDLGDEVGCGIQSRLKLAQVVVVPPVARELLRRRELHALRRIGDRLRFGPLGRVDSLAQVGELGFRKRNAERTNCSFVTGLLCNSSFGHCVEPPWRTEQACRASGKACRCETYDASASEPEGFRHAVPPSAAGRWERSDRLHPEGSSASRVQETRGPCSSRLAVGRSNLSSKRSRERNGRPRLGSSPRMEGVRWAGGSARRRRQLCRPIALALPPHPRRDRRQPGADRSLSASPASRAGASRSRRRPRGGRPGTSRGRGRRGAARARRSPPSSVPST
jgi:hypothetical protein